MMNISLANRLMNDKHVRERLTIERGKIKTCIWMNNINNKCAYVDRYFSNIYLLRR